jgi:hypothetical protein
MLAKHWTRVIFGLVMFMIASAMPAIQTRAARGTLDQGSLDQGLIGRW